MTDSEKLDLILSEMHDMRSEMQGMKDEMQNMKGEMQDIKRRTTNIELTLENETNPNIKIIAEGHLDLNRKLDDVLKVENEKELLLIRVNTIENELHKIKERIEIIA